MTDALALIADQPKPAQQSEKKPPPKKMKKWSDDPSALVQYSKLISPLKSIIDKGYRLIRNDVKSFEYDGFNIGKNELQLFQSPKTLFTEKHLEKENKRNIKLIDVVLHVVFLLGIEQGRRSEHRDQKPTELMLNTLEQYRETNKNLRYENDELRATIKIRENHPELSRQEQLLLIEKEVLTNRNKRIMELKTDLALDQTRSNCTMRIQERAKFKDLFELSKSLTVEDYKKHWLDILKEYGWTVDDWNNKCKKKNQKVLVLD
jgi:hypothetical protein